MDDRSLSEHLAQYSGIQPPNTDLLNELRIARKQAEYPSCRACRWLAGQDDDVQAFVQQWIRDRIETKVLYLTLRKHGMQISQTTLRNHARECVLSQEVKNVNSD